MVFFPAYCQTDIAFAEQISPKLLDHPRSRLNTVHNIMKCVVTLEQEHKQHVKQMYQKDVYGSEFAPIGEDNYLLLSASRQVPAKHPLEVTRC